jgi:hypothetical protein
MNLNLKEKFGFNWYRHCNIFEKGNGDLGATTLVGVGVAVVAVVGGVGGVGAVVIIDPGAVAVVVAVVVGGVGAVALALGANGVLISYLHTGHLLSRINHEVMPDWVKI